jgi:hypothetical protein
MKPGLSLTAALFVVLLAISGCGGGGDSTASAPVETTAEPTALTKEELLAQGDAICAEVNAAVGTVASTAGTNGAAQVAQESDLYGGMVERLKALGAPSDDSAGYPEFIAAAEQLAQAESDAQLAAERGEEGGVATAESEAASSLASFQTAARSYGFEACGEAPSAPTPSSSGEESSEESESESEEGAPEEAEPAPEGAVEEGGGGAAAGGGTGGGTESGGGSSGGIGPG